MYTLTVKIAAGGTTYTNSNGSHPSAFGHMWYSISDGGTPNSFGFAPKDENIYDPMGPGHVVEDDNSTYQWTYYTGQIVIDSNQYQKLLAFGTHPEDAGFNLYYRGLVNSCIDFTWKALYLAGFNPSNFEGNIFPDSNADDADKQLYKYLMGDLSGWDSSQPNAGDYHVIYGSSGDDTLVAALDTDALYGGGGIDNLIGSVLNDFLDGGSEGDTLEGGIGYDTYYSGDGDTIDDSDGKGEVNFEGFKLTGGTHTGTYETFKTYEGDGGIYVLRSDGTLIFSKNGNFVTINNYHKESNSLGIVLTGADLSLSIFAPVVKEADGTATGAITLSQAYTEDIIVTMYTQDDTATAGSDYTARPTFDIRITAGETYVTFDVSILDNTTEEAPPTETFYALAQSVRTLSGADVPFTLTDVQPFSIEDDDLLPVNSLIKSKLHQKAA